MLLRKLLKNRGLGMNLLASLCLLALFIYTWDLDMGELGRRLLAILLALVILVAAAACIGWCLYRFRRRTQQDIYPADDTPGHERGISTDRKQKDD